MRDVEVKLFDKHIYPTHFDESENVYKGNLALKNDSIYITYKDENGVTTIIKTIGSKVIVKRIGALGGQLTFETGKANPSKYATPYGMLPINVVTSKCNVYLLEKGIKIYIEYALEMDDEKVSENTFMMITN